MGKNRERNDACLYISAEDSMNKGMNNRFLFLLPTLFFFIYSFASIIRHLHLGSFGYDLGIYTQVLWLYSQFEVPLSSIRGTNIWGDHFAPSFMLLAPFFWLYPSAITLLVLQSLVVVSGAIPLGFLARKLVPHKIFPFSIQFSYLLFFGVQNALLFDVHMITFATGFLCWMIFFAVSRRWFLYWTFFVLSLLWKEDVSTLLAAWGGTMVMLKNVRAGALTIFLSVGWFFFVTRVGIPAFNTDGLFKYNASFPHDVQGWMSVFLDPPEKIQTILQSFGSFSFLPLLSPVTLLPVLSHFFVNFLDPAFYGRWGISLHYRVPLAPFLAFSGIAGVASLLRAVPHKWKQLFLTCASIVLILSTLFAQWKLHLPLNGLAKPAFYKEEQWMRDTREVIKHLPPNVSVGTFNNLASHIATRRDIRMIGPTGFPHYQGNAEHKSIFSSFPCGERACPWIFTNAMEYILVDFHPGQPDINFWWENRGQLDWNPAPETNSGIYCTMYRKGNTALLRAVWEDGPCVNQQSSP